MARKHQHDWKPRKIMGRKVDYCNGCEKLRYRKNGHLRYRKPGLLTMSLTKK